MSLGDFDLKTRLASPIAMRVLQEYKNAWDHCTRMDEEATKALMAYGKFGRDNMKYIDANSAEHIEELKILQYVMNDAENAKNQALIACQEAAAKAKKFFPELAKTLNPHNLKNLALLFVSLGALAWTQFHVKTDT